jgi:hypothetical protein
MQRSAFKGIVYYEKASSKTATSDLPLFIFHHGSTFSHQKVLDSLGLFLIWFLNSYWNQFQQES